MADREGRTPAGPPWWEIGAVIASALAIVGIREFLIYRGDLYGEDQLRLSLLVGAAVLLVVSTWIFRVTHIGGLLGAVGFFVALAGAFQLVLPPVQDATAPGPCPGAQTRNVEMIGITHPNGTNVRSGPSRTYRPTKRFAGNCSVGFDSYCLGDAEPDLFYQSRANITVYDMRWYQLPDDRGIVHAGVVASQGLDDQLPQEPCAGDVGMPDEPEVVTKENDDGTMTVTATAEGAANVGFAAFGYVDDELYLHRDGLIPKSSDGFTHDWPLLDVTVDGPASGTLSVAAVVCLAAEVPANLVDDVEATLPDWLPELADGPAGTAVAYANLSEADQDRVRRKACLLPDVSTATDGDTEAEAEEGDEPSS